MSEVTRREWMTGVSASVAACALGSSLQVALGHSLPTGSMKIPAGTFLKGTTKADAVTLAYIHGYHPSWLDGEVPRQALYLPAYAIDRYPVTNYEYALFCLDTGHPPPTHWHGSTPPQHLLTHPVSMVNQADAKTFAAWAGRRLPTEAEWEKAARGVNGRTYPWGDTFDPTACQWNPDPSSYGPGTAPVTAHPNGASPYGVMDMVGNVSEWCADGPSPTTAFVKGGSWITGEVINLRPAGRNMSGSTTTRHTHYGFRCAKDLS